MRVDILVNEEVKKCKAEYYSDLINKNKGNTSELWKTFNDIRSKKSNSTITSIVVNGVLYTEINEIAQALNTHFSRGSSRYRNEASRQN